MQIPGDVTIGRHTHSGSLGIDLPGFSNTITRQSYRAATVLFRVLRDQHSMTVVHYFLAKWKGGFEFCCTQPTLLIQALERHIWRPPLVLTVGDYIIGRRPNNQIWRAHLLFQLPRCAAGNFQRSR